MPQAAGKLLTLTLPNRIRDMRFRIGTTAALAMVVSLLAAGCGDSGLSPPEPPNTPAVAKADHFLLGSPLQVDVLQRDTPLTEAQTTSARVGIFGGVMTLPGAGLQVIIPPFAVTHAMTLTVTAPAGSSVAYEFGPHGTQFLVPLVVVQDLSHTNLNNLNPLALFAGYYDALDQSNGTGSITELLNVNVNLASLSAVFTVRHFSGYLVASGRSGSLR
jgi:hypothetical protein